MLYIVTLDEMKAELGIDDPQDDAVLTRWIEGMQERFDDHLQRTLLRGVGVTEYFDGGYRSIYVSRYPVETLTSVHVDSDQEWGSNTALETDERRLIAAEGRIVYGIAAAANWPEGIRNIRVVYTGGYRACDATVGDNAMPDAVRRAFFMQLGFEWRNRTHLGQQDVSAQGARISLAPAKLLPEVVATLSPYRRIL